jgi:hypothetical protein
MHRIGSTVLIGPITQFNALTAALPALGGPIASTGQHGPFLAFGLLNARAKPLAGSTVAQTRPKLCFKPFFNVLTPRVFHQFVHMG